MTVVVDPHVQVVDAEWLDEDEEHERCEFADCTERADLRVEIAKGSRHATFVLCASCDRRHRIHAVANDVVRQRGER